MISPISFYSPAFRGVTIKRDDETKEAIEKMPEGSRAVAESGLENLRTSLDKKYGDKRDLEICLAYYVMPKDCPHNSLGVHIYNTKGSLCQEKDRPCYSRFSDVDEDSISNTNDNVAKMFAAAERETSAIMDAIEEGREAEILHELKICHDEKTKDGSGVAIGKNYEDLKKMAKGLSLLDSNADMLLIMNRIATLPAMLEYAISENPSPSMKDKKFAIELDYDEYDENGTKRGKSEIRLIDMDKLEAGDEDPCIYKVSGSDVVSYRIGRRQRTHTYISPASAVTSALRKADSEMREFLEKYQG